MAIFRPFQAIRPQKDLASRVAALPYDVMNSQEARELAKDNPYSFLQVDKAEIALSLRWTSMTIGYMKRRRRIFCGWKKRELI